MGGLLTHGQRPPIRFKSLTSEKTPAEWLASTEAVAVADTVVKYQFPSGGWSKNIDWNLPPEGSQLKARQEAWRQIHSKNGVGSTIDNGATTSEMKYLAMVYEALGNKELVGKQISAKRVKLLRQSYRAAFLKGVDYLLEAQYDNGGWPQFYPKKPLNSEGHPFYSDHITFNDNAMVNVLKMIRDMAEDRKSFYRAINIPAETKARLAAAFDKGIECILNCQIKKNGKLTVWCQQHDEKTLEPAPARSYELASFNGSHETPELLQLLMSLPEPNDRVVEAVSSAVAWLEAHALKDVRQESFVNVDGKRDRRLVHHFGSKTWARYYDLETEEPYVCDRDGVKQPSLEYIGYERRNGYGWYSTAPQEVIDAFPEWLRRVRSQP